MDYRLDRERREESARRIQVFWRTYQDQKLFHYLINTIRSAEQCLAPAVLRQISPLEVNLLRDRSVQFTVRFRFSGSQFPPVIVFKIFHMGRAGRYLSGQKLFRSSNQATAETCRIMGNRRFMDLLRKDEVSWRGRAIADPLDVTCMRDYIQYSSHLDELPACLGGKENGWRRLGLQVLSRDRGPGAVVKNLWKSGLSGTARRPAGPLRSPTAPPSSVVTSRRSARAQSVSARRKRLYTRGVLEEEQEEKLSCSETGEDIMAGEEVKNPGRSVSEVLDEDSLWEEEAEELCCWTSQITLDTIGQLDDL